MKLALVAAAALVLGCAPLPAADGPIVRAPSPRPAPTVAPRRFTVVSFNVHLGEDPEALARSMIAGGLGDADVYLIQEIEDHVPAEPKPRAEVLAAALGTAFVYAPARRLAHGGLGNHGLAVLSRWPIVEDVVLRLPFEELLWSPRHRIALGVLLDVAGTGVQVWNVHLDTRIALGARVRQATPVFERARVLPGLAIVGGDFNTWAPVDQRAIDQLATDEGFAAPTAELSDTVAGGVFAWPPQPPVRLDAIYTRGFAVAGAGVVREVRGSDHAPIWTQVFWPAVTAR